MERVLRADRGEDSAPLSDPPELDPPANEPSCASDTRLKLVGESPCEKLDAGCRDIDLGREVTCSGVHERPGAPAPSPSLRRSGLSSSVFDRDISGLRVATGLLARGPGCPVPFDALLSSWPLVPALVTSTPGATVEAPHPMGRNYCPHRQQHLGGESPHASQDATTLLVLTTLAGAKESYVVPLDHMACHMASAPRR